MQDLGKGKQGTWCSGLHDIKSFQKKIIERELQSIVLIFFWYIFNAN